MKRLTIGCIVLLATAWFASCGHKNHDGVYVANLRSEYSIAEDTIVIKDNIVTNRVGYSRILNGQLKPKEWRVKKWILNDPYSPIVELGEHQITIGTTVYKQVEP
jgi:hypothetical protein